MASALRKLLRTKSPAAKGFITASFNASQALNPSEPIPLHHSPFLDLHRQCDQPNTTPTPTPTSTPSPATQHHFTVIYPSFPFGFASKPIFATGFCSPEPEPEDAGLDDSRTIWADSVKKKRKRKMNKHKYKKLRKRMRRQT